MGKPNLFTPAQIDKLRKEFGSVEKISVEKGEQLGRMLDQLPLPVLEQLRDAKIRFVSSLALNRIIRHESKK